MGGVDKVKRQRDQGRLTVRDRIDGLVDAKSFHEIGAISGIAEYDESGELTNLTPANCVFGRGRIDGRTVVVVGDDFTVRGGSADARRSSSSRRGRPPTPCATRSATSSRSGGERRASTTPASP